MLFELCDPLTDQIVIAGEIIDSSYRELLEGMVSLFEHNLEGSPQECAKRARALAALCVGGMVIARALPGTDTAEEIRSAALDEANAVWMQGPDVQAA